VEVRLVSDRDETVDGCRRYVGQPRAAVQACVPLLAAEGERDLEDSEAGSERELLAGAWSEARRKMAEGMLESLLTGLQGGSRLLGLDKRLSAL